MVSLKTETLKIKKPKTYFRFKKKVSLKERAICSNLPYKLY